jgi:hypothetical protein
MYNLVMNIKFNEGLQKETFILPNVENEIGEIERVAQKYSPQNPSAFAQSFIEKAKATKLVSLTDDMWSKLDNSDSWQIEKGNWTKVAETVDHYNKETNSNRTWENLKQQMEDGQEIEASIVLKYLNELHLVSGNTRLMVTRALGKVPKVLLVEMESINTEVKLDETGKKFKEKLLSYFETLENPIREKLLQALNLALDLHQDQKDRPDGPYVNHILRVTDRIINDFGIHNRDVSTAAPLHDSVEDQAKKLAILLGKDGGNEQANALQYIKENFGDEVARIVSGVTNPEEMDSLEPTEKNQKYIEHVVEVIEDPKVFYVKFSDFCDNGLSIQNIQDPKKQKKLAGKYLPLYQIFIDRIKKDDIQILPDKKQELIDKLFSVKSFAESLA